MSGRFKKVVLIQGGDSEEREVSLDSSKMVGEMLERICERLVRFDPKDSSFAELVAIKPDAAFIILHGGSGEDGTVQAALEMLGIPHTGSGHHACSVAMDKNLAKLKWVDEGLPTPPWLMVGDSSEGTLDEIQLQLGHDLFVKPNTGGSSIATRRVHDRAQLTEAIDECVPHDRHVLVEQAIAGMELTYGIIGDEILPGIRIEVAGEFYDYEAKYISDDTKFICPPEIPAEVDEECRQLALAAFASLGCRGWGRVDMMVSGREPHLLEINPVPGMTSHSLVPHAAAKAGIDEQTLIARILELAE